MGCSILRLLARGRATPHRDPDDVEFAQSMQLGRCGPIACQYVARPGLHAPTVARSPGSSWQISFQLPGLHNPRREATSPSIRIGRQSRLWQLSGGWGWGNPRTFNYLACKLGAALGLGDQSPNGVLRPRGTIFGIGFKPNSLMFRPPTPATCSYPATGVRSSLVQALIIGIVMSVQTEKLELAIGEAYSGSQSAQPQFKDGSVYRIRWWSWGDSNPLPLQCH